MSPVGFSSHVDGAEDFVYLLREPLFNYGSEIVIELFRTAFLSSQKTPRVQLPLYEEGMKSSSDTDDMEMRSGTVSNAVSLRTPRLAHQASTPTLSQKLQSFTPPTDSSDLSTDTANLRTHIRSLRTTLTDDPSILPWPSIAGLDHAKASLEEFAAIFFHFPHLTQPLRHQTVTGVLLFGPHGTGKTLLAKSFAAHHHFAFYDIRASAIMSKYLGDSEKFIKELFLEVRANAPAVLFLDECDGLLCNPAQMDGSGGGGAQTYRLLQNELKNQWSDLIYGKSAVVVMAASNKPHDIDMDGFGRRLSLKLYVDLPDATACGRILEGGLAKMRHRVRTDQMLALGEMCAYKGLTGFDVDCVIEGLVRKGLSCILSSDHFKFSIWEGKEVVIPCDEDDLEAIECAWTAFEDQEKLSYRPFSFGLMTNAIDKTRPTVDAAMIARHEQFASLYCT